MFPVPPEHSTESRLLYQYLKRSGANIIADKFRPAMSIDEVQEFMYKEYNSISRQIQVRHSLQALRMDEFMADHSLNSPSDALSKMINHLLTLQCPLDFPQDDRKIAYLRAAVLGKAWTRTPVSKADGGGMSWNQFVADLHAAIPLETERKPAIAGTSTHFIEPKDLALLDNLYYGRYNPDPRNVRKNPMRGHPSQGDHPSNSSGTTPVMMLPEAIRQGK